VIEGNDFVYLENINETSEEKTPATPAGSFTSVSDDELKTRLQQALAEEAYEKAAKIRDELNKRKAS
jgi:protein-arginine kinase activator protein McsA